MSDTESTLTPAPDSTPDTSTAAIAEQTYEQLEAADSAASDPGDGLERQIPATPEAPAAEAPAASETPGVVLSREEQLLAEFGFKEARKPDGREHWIPRSKVLKMIGSGLKRGDEKWAAEKTTLDGELTGYRTKFGEVQPVLEALDQGPEAFMAEAAKYDPRYKAFLESRQAPAAPAAEVAFPEPDYDLGNGAKTYSIAGIKQIVAHAVQVAKAEAKAEAEAALKPVTERERKAAEEAQQRTASEAIREKTRATMQEAASWPHFGPLAADGSLTPFQTEVLTLLREDSEKAKAAGRRPALTLEGAYIKVVGKRLVEDENTTRAKILKEVSTAARAQPAVPRAGAEVPAASTGRVSTQDIAARALARLEGA